MQHWHIQLIRKDDTLPKTIRIKRGVYQGDAISPLIFILTTASILEYLRTNKEINRTTKGKHEIIAFMDDIKCHTHTQQAMETITEKLRQGAEELGLTLNINKCGTYNNNKTDEEHDNTSFIPQIKTGYKYLDQGKIITKTRELLDSKLTTHQKRKIYNSSIIPAAIYITGNIYPNELIETTLKKCRDMDTAIRKIAVEKLIKTRPTSNQRFYLPTSIGGLKFRSIETETKIQLVRRYFYLIHHPELKETNEKYATLHHVKYRTPISDYQYIKNQYEIEEYANADYRQATRRTIKTIKTKE